MNITEDLKKIIKGEVYNDSKTLDRFSRDASMFQVRPQVVVAPKDVEDIKNLVKYASGRLEVGLPNGSPTSGLKRISLTPSAGRSDMSGGVLTESVVVDFTKHINQLKKVGDDYAVVEPGMYYRDFEKETLKKNLLLPPYPASRELCAIGGMVGNNAGGEKTLAYGKTEEFVRELKVVLADGNEYTFHALGVRDLEEKLKLKTFEGEVYRGVHRLLGENYELIKRAKPNVSKNSAGYYLWNVWDKKTGIFDLTKLIVGSQGTLGIVTEVTFRLVKPKPFSKMLVIFMRNIGDLAKLVGEVLKFKPESFESYDDKTLKLVFSYFGDFIKKLGAGNIIKLAFDFLPEVKMVLTGGLPKLILMVEFTGITQKETDDQARKAEKHLTRFAVSTHLVKDELEAKKYWTIRREAFNLLRSHSRKKRSVPFIDDVIVRPEKLPEFLPRLYEILDSYQDQVTFAIGGHPGDGNFHIYSIIDIANPQTRAAIPEISDKVYNLVIEMGGSITAEHNDGLIRSPYLAKMYGERVYGLFREVKSIFDPKGIFNPGKKVNASLDYILKHIRIN